MRYFVIFCFLVVSLWAYSQQSSFNVILSASSTTSAEIEGRYNHYSVGISYGKFHCDKNYGSEVQLTYNSNDVYGAQRKNLIFLTYNWKKYFLLDMPIRLWLGANVGYGQGKDAPRGIKIAQWQCLAESGIESIIHSKYRISLRALQAGFLYKKTSKKTPLVSKGFNINDADGFPIQLSIGLIF